MKRKSIEAPPLKRFKEGVDEGLRVTSKQDLEVKSKDDLFFRRCKGVAGVKDAELANTFLDQAARSIESVVGTEPSKNIIAQSFNEFQPKDALEARLVGQAAVAYTHAMHCIKKVGGLDIIYQIEHLMNLGIKLMRVHNETVDMISRYRRGGEQKVTVTHAVITEKAIVNNFSGIGGGVNQNQGASPCSSQNAEQKPEQTNISHVDSQLCPMEDVDCMEVKASGRKQNEAKNA